MTAGDKTIILKAEKISKSFPGVQALDAVDLQIHRGMVNALVGENGAGKSTLMKILSGVISDYAGSLVLDGKPVSFKNPKEAEQAGIAIIHQELNLVPNLSVAENIFLGREPTTILGFVDFPRMHAASQALLDQLELKIAPQTPVSQLRVGRQQIVEIAKALSLNARVIIMDEPTSALSEQDVDVLFKIIHNLIQQHVAIVYITHKLDEIFKIAQHVTVLRDGRFVATRQLRDVTYDDLVTMMVGRDVDNFFVKEHRAGDKTVFSVSHLTVPHASDLNRYMLNDISFHIKQGEVLGVFGLMGAGRTELLETLFGLHAAVTGEIVVNDDKVEISSPGDAIAAGIALVPEDRKQDGLIGNMSVAQNTSLAHIDQIIKTGLLNDKKEKALARQAILDLNIKTPSTAQIVENLSGGNQQKVVLAKWLVTNPKVLLLDEPTRGIDIGAKHEIYQLVNELAQQGIAILFVSSELPEIMAIADRIIVLARGHLTTSLDPHTATEEDLLKAAI